jgi:hypothetical protein
MLGELKLINIIISIEHPFFTNLRDQAFIGMGKCVILEKVCPRTKAEAPV